MWRILACGAPWGQFLSATFHWPLLTIDPQVFAKQRKRLEKIFRRCILCLRLLAEFVHGSDQRAIADVLNLPEHNREGKRAHKFEKGRQLLHYFLIRRNSREDLRLRLQASPDGVLETRHIKGDTGRGGLFQVALYSVQIRLTLLESPF